MFQNHQTLCRPLQWLRFWHTCSESKWSNVLVLQLGYKLYGTNWVQTFEFSAVLLDVEATLFLFLEFTTLCWESWTRTYELVSDEMWQIARVKATKWLLTIAFGPAEAVGLGPAAEGAAFRAALLWLPVNAAGPDATPCLLSHELMLWPTPLHLLHLIRVPTFDTLVVLGFSPASLFLFFFGLPGIFTYPGALGFGLLDTAQACIFIKAVCFEKNAWNCMRAGQARQLPVSTRACHCLKINCEPMIPMFDFKFVSSITNCMAITWDFYVGIQLFQDVWTY